MVSGTKILFSNLEGWDKEDHSEALEVFSRSSNLISGLEERNTHSILNTKTSAKTFFEEMFIPTVILPQKEVLFTGYYEPEISGSILRDDEFKYPIYSKPKELNPLRKWFSRRDIEEKNILKHRNLELLFLRSKLDVFLLQLQGSGRINLRNGSVIRVGYDCKNGHDYVSIGKILVERRVFSSRTISHEGLKDWIIKNPKEGNELMYENPSYVFFKVISDLDIQKGPIGTAKIPLQSLRSIAVDPAHIPLGSPIWIEKKGYPSLKRIMIAQDTGSAIVGPSRADIYCGTGKIAEKMAGGIKEYGNMVVLRKRN